MCSYELILLYFIQGSCDTAQPKGSMDTSGVSNVDNPPLSSAEPFHFTASMEAHSTTLTANTSVNMTSTEGGLASKVDDSPSLKDSTTLGDVPSKLKSTSESYYTVKPMKASNTEYTPDCKAAIDKTYDDNDDNDGDDDDVDDSQHDETSPFITTKQQRQIKTRHRLKSQHIMASEHSYNSIEDTQPLIEE